MHTKLPPIVLAVIFASISAVSAQLPSINKKPWEEYFIVLKQRHIQFGITTDGDAVFYPLSKRGEIISESRPITFNIEILEAKPDNKFVSKKIDPKSLKSDHSATLNPDKPVVYTGSVTGGATFQIIITPARDGFTFSGKITSKGNITDPLQIGVTMRLRPYIKDATRTVTETKNLEKRIRRDYLEAVIASGNRKKYEFAVNANLNFDMPNGVESLSMKAEAYDYTEFQVASVGGAKIMFEDKEQLIYDGIDFRWIMPIDADPAVHSLKIAAK